MTYGSETTNNSQRKPDNGHIKSLRGRQASLLKEISRITTDRISIERLNAINADNNERSANVGSFKAGAIRGACIDQPLVLGCDHHHGNVLVDVKVDVCRGCEAFDYCFCFFDAAFADEPPW